MTAGLDTGPPDGRRGALYRLLAAGLFGLSAPIAKHLLGEVSPQVLAGLLYLGSGVGLSAWRVVRPSDNEAPSSPPCRIDARPSASDGRASPASALRLGAFGLLSRFKPAGAGGQTIPFVRPWRAERRRICWRPAREAQRHPRPTSAVT